MSTTHYMTAFIPPLIEETHAELLSRAQLLPQAPACELTVIGPCKRYKPPNDLFYKVSLIRRRETKNYVGTYEPEVGDLILLSDVRPTCIDDLRQSYVIALVYKRASGSSNVLSILSSKPIEEGLTKNRQLPSIVGQDMQKNEIKEKFFAVHLINMTSNIRIWNALNLELEGKNMSLVEKVLKFSSIVRNIISAEI